MTSHINNTILEQLFTNYYDKVNSANNPFRADNTFELAQSENLSATFTKINLFEEFYLGKFSTLKEKIIHIMLYTCPDILYDVNLLSSLYFVPSAPAFHGTKYLICYLSVCPHRPIMYPAYLKGTTTHDLRQEVSPGDFHSQNISNGLDFFVSGVEG